MTAYGQRVYANSEQHSTKISVVVTLSEVQNPENAITSNENTFSTLYLGVGALGLYSANQNLQFTDTAASQLKPTSPIMVKMKANGSALNLLGSITFQRTSGGTNVGDIYTANNLLDLLGLVGNTEEDLLLMAPAPSTATDGIRMSINAVLNVGNTAQLYYAFYITPPTLSQTSITLCSNTAGTVAISNFQTGYTYRLYTQEVGGTEIEQTTTNNLAIPADLPAADYWLEAREDDLYPSAREKITVIRNPLPTITLSAVSPICQKETLATLSYTATANNPTHYSLVWADSTSGFINVSNKALPTDGTIRFSVPAQVAAGVYTATLKVKNQSTGCESEAYSFSLLVNAKPDPPDLHIITNAQY